MTLWEPICGCGGLSERNEVIEIEFPTDVSTPGSNGGSSIMFLFVYAKTDAAAMDGTYHFAFL